MNSMYRILLKGFLDRIIALCALVLLSPVLLVLWALLRISLGPRVIFRQERPGYRGRPFIICKFRTMTDARDASGELLPDEERATRVGQIVRSLSVDELPELFNVLKGDMSLVGPRPLLMRYLPRYSAEQARRHNVLPGITGWAQVNGRNDIAWDLKLAMDVWYVDHISFRLDLSILATTVWKVVRRDGIGQEGHFSSSEFMGPGS
jgi:lipopolysaccharide/colanic/teichoic acid biosynthesis glycosyltransferase